MGIQSYSPAHFQVVTKNDDADKSGGAAIADVITSSRYLDMQKSNQDDGEFRRKPMTIFHEFSSSNMFSL